jgi:hypothetical protein
MKYLFLLVSLGTALTCAGQNLSQKHKADSLYTLGQWTNAVNEYRKILKADPSNPYALYKTGKCWQQLKKPDAALACYKEAFKNGGRIQIMADVAGTFLSLHKKDSAYTWLKRMADQGYTDYQRIEKDSLLNTLKNETAYALLLKQIKINNAPCSASPEFRDFDFWIGNWDVTSNGQPAGKSSIRLILDSCVIFENWKGLKEGKSFNMYDAISKTWKQTWVDYSGAWTEFKDGKYANGKMLFYTANEKQKDGSFTKRRLSFFNLDPNHVRQFSEQSKDDGKTWTVEYDFLYTREAGE